MSDNAVPRAASASIRQTSQPPVSLRRLVPALGIAQIISWGTLFYAIAVLGESMRQELAISASWLFGAFTVGLFVSGLASPLAGRMVDARGGRFVLACGSLLGAAALGTLAVADSLPVLFIGWTLAGVASAACLYDPAFSTLHQLSGTSYRRAVTALTLFGGFASTVFWPLSQLLLDAVGWRATWLIYALLHLGVCLPLHVFFVPRRSGGVVAEVEPERSSSAASRPAHGAVFVWLALALSLAAFLSSTLSAHLITLLKAAGLGARDAVLVSALIGPMQVAGRVAEFAFARKLHPLTVGTLAFVLMALALASLTQVAGPSIAAFAFAALYGWSNGIMTIVRGTVPAELFGRRGYGTLLGRLARPAFMAKAIAPVAFTLALGASVPREMALYALTACAVLALIAYLLAVARR